MLKQILRTSSIVAIASVLPLITAAPAKSIPISFDWQKILNLDFKQKDLELILDDGTVLYLDLNKLNSVLSGDLAPEINGVSDPTNLIKTAAVSILGKDGGIDWNSILNSPTFLDNSYQIANGSIKLGRQNGGLPISIDYVQLSQVLQASNKAIAGNNAKSQENNEATESIFKDASMVYADVSATTPNSTLEAIEQSNKIAIANGLAGIAQTKHVQTLVRSLEINNTLEQTKQERERAERLKKEFGYGIGARDLGISRALSRRK